MLFPKKIDAKSSNSLKFVIPSEEHFCKGNSKHLGSFRGDEASIAMSKKFY